MTSPHPEATISTPPDPKFASRSAPRDARSSHGRAPQRHSAGSTHLRSQDHARLREQLTALVADNLYSQFLRDQSLAAFEEDRLADVRDILERFLQVRTGSSALAGERDFNLAMAEAALGWIAMLEGEFQRATDHFHRADRHLPLEAIAERRDYQHAQAEAYDRLGTQPGNDDALRKAIQLRRVLLRRTSLTKQPTEWRTLQNEIGNTCLVLGERESRTGPLKQAVAAFRLAISDGLREQRPLEWAMAQTKIGVALTWLGEREDRASRLREAVLAFHDALSEITRDRAPAGWALAQNYLGLALSLLADHESGTARLEEAAYAFRAALQERTREHTPRDWARTQHNLGVTLLALAERQSSARSLEEAAAAFHAALEERTVSRAPLEWAVTRFGLAKVLASLGMREGGTTRLTEAIEGYREVLGVLAGGQDKKLTKEVRARLAQAEHVLAGRGG
jgi:tetratricopeptide (TPR) repeat protein